MQESETKVVNVNVDEIILLNIITSTIRYKREK